MCVCVFDVQSFFQTDVMVIRSEEQQCVCVCVRERECVCVCVCV